MVSTGIRYAHRLLLMTAASWALSTTQANAQAQGAAPDPRAAQDSVNPEAPKRNFTFTPRATVDLTYTDNVLLTATNRKPDVITSPSAGFTVIGEGARTRVSADGDLHYDAYKSTTRLNSLRSTARATADISLIEQMLDLKTSAATDQQRINSFVGTPATDRSFGPNQSQVFTYGATPTLKWSVGNFFKATTLYDIALVNYINAAGNTNGTPASDSIQQRVAAALESGSYFDVLTWTANASLQREERAGPNAGSEKRAGEASLFYAVVPNFQTVVTAGYDDIREATLPGVTGGLHATGGFRWSLSRRTQVSFDSGIRYESPYFQGQITYGVGRGLVLRASYSETVDTPQSLAASNLAGLTRDNLGNLINPTTGLPADPNDNPFGQNNQAFRRKTFEFGVNGVLGRNTYNVSGSHERRLTNTTSTSLRGNLSLGRQLGPRLRAGLTAGYERVTGGTTARTSETVRGGAALDYELGKRTSASLSYFFQRQHANPTYTRESGALLKLVRKF